MPRREISKCAKPRSENLTACGNKHFVKQNACQISTTG